MLGSKIKGFNEAVLNHTIKRFILESDCPLQEHLHPYFFLEECVHMSICSVVSLLNGSYRARIRAGL